MRRSGQRAQHTLTGRKGYVVTADAAMGLAGATLSLVNFDGDTDDMLVPSSLLREPDYQAFTEPTFTADYAAFRDAEADTMTDNEIAEGRLRAYDYDAWASL